MKTYYFKTAKRFYQWIANLKTQGLTPDVCVITCACGESNGALVYSQGKQIEKLVLCVSCYNSASNQQRGE